MKLRHERPMPDLAYEVTAPLALELPDGQRLDIRQWSLAGFTVPEGTIPPRRGTLTIPFQGVDVRFPVTLEPAEDPSTLLFTGLSGRERETLAIFYRSILSGRMATTGEMITSLDTPVDLVPMGETEAEKTAASQSDAARVWRLVRTIAVQVALAAAVFGYAGSLAWDRFAFVHPQNGRIVAPVTDHTVDAPASAKRILVSVGDRVARGDTLVVLESPERTGALETTRSEIRLVQAQIAEAEARLERLITTITPSTAIAPVPRLRPDPDAPAIGRTPAPQTSSVDSTLAVLEARGDAAARGEAGLVRELRDQIERGRLDLAALKRRLAGDKERLAALNVVATADGIVRAIAAFEGQALRRGDPVVSVEADTGRTAVGWLPERAAGSVFVGQPATVTVRASDDHLEIAGAIAQVLAVDEPGRGFGARVVIALPADSAQSRVPAGAPAAIAARRPWARLPWTAAPGDS